MGTPPGRRAAPRAALWAPLAALVPAACAPAPAPGDAREPRTAPCFDARVELATRGKPEGVLVHDFDGDGRAELLAATRSPGSLHVWRSPTEPPRVIPLPDYPLGPRLLEGPNGPRAALVSRASRELLVADPCGPADAELERRALPGTPRAFGVGPAGAAGRPAIALATREGELVLLEGERLRRTDLEDDLATFVAFAGGWIVVGSQARTCVRAYRPGGEASWTRGPALELGGIPRACVERGDELWIAGGDHALWIVSAPGQDGALELREERRADAIPVDLEPCGASGDLAALSFYDLRYAIESGGSQGARGYAGQDPWDASCGDLDGDGLRDLAVANRGAQRVSVLLGAPGGGFHEGQRVPVGRGPHSLATGDLDGDGSPEILVVTALGGELVVLRREGAAFEVTERHDARPAGDVVAVGDLDGDGRPDAAFAVHSAHGSRLRALFGAREAGLVAREASGDLALGVGVGGLVLADLDGDGRVEALLADPDGGAVHVAGASKEGVLAARQSLAVPSAPRALVALEGGRAFAVAAGEPGPRLGVALLAVEDGVLVERAFLATEQAPLDVAAGDVDGDGSDELVLLAKIGRGDGPGIVRILERTGDHDWSPVFEGPTGLRPYSVAAGDIDGDGRADVVVGAQNSHHVNAWLGREGPSLQPLPDLGCGRGPLDVAVADLDGDGRGEVLVANDFSNDVSVLAVRPDERDEER